MKKYVLHLSACAMAVALVACGGGNNDTTKADGPPVITTQPASLTVVSGSNATMSVVASGGGTLTYKWRKDGVEVSDITAASFTITPVSPARAGVYDVIVSNSLGSVTSSTATLTVGVVPAISTQPVAQTIAAGSPVTFTVVATGSDTLTYQWRKASVNIAGATAASYTIGSVAAADAAVYDVVITNTYGSATSNTAGLTVN
jgi:hypothetical protein